jgi:hypothetical protein
MVEELRAMTAISLYARTENRSSGRRLGFVAAAAFLGGVSLLALPAQAAHGSGHRPDKQSDKQPVQEDTTTLAAQDPETTGSIQSQSDNDANCARSRMRLWVEGEGWIVRKVTTCY